MIYRYENIVDFTTEQLDDAIRRLPYFRCEKALTYRFKKDRVLSVLAYLLFMEGLEAQYGITEPQIWEYGVNGKPYIVDNRDIHFNISHCAKAVVCIFSDEEVGVDVEVIEPLDISVARHIARSEERRVGKECRL